MKKLNFIVIFLFLFFFGVLLLNVPVPIGLADNTDFHRITLPFGMEVDENLRFFYFQMRFDYIKTSNSLVEHIQFIVNPGVRLTEHFRSTQFIPVKLAQFLNGLILGMRYGKIEHFDIRTLGIVLMIVHSTSIALLWLNYPVQNKAIRVALLVITILIYYDLGYLLYYHSLFGEAVTLASFLLWIAAFFYLLQNEKKSYVMLAVYFFSSSIFVGSKVANIPLGVFIAVFSLYFFFQVKNTVKRAMVLIGICSLLMVSLYYYRAIPNWMKKIDNYHSIFFGILKNSENPEQDLQSLGIDAKYAVLANTHGFVEQIGVDIYSEEFQKEIYDRAGPVQVSLYYLKNPRRLLEKLITSSEASLMIRPQYLGNFSKAHSDEIIKFSGRFSLWESLRKKLSGFAFPFFSGILVLYLILVLVQLQIYLKHDGRRDRSQIWWICARLMLLLFTGIQWIFPVIGNGECDLAKHMFLFNLLFDTIFIMLLVDSLRLLEQKKLNNEGIYAGIALLAIVLCISFYQKPNRNNKTIEFGKYSEMKLTWDILLETDTYIFVVAKNIISNRPFSLNNDGTWQNSDVRRWLNDTQPGGFLYEFTQSERERILPTSRKTILAPYLSETRDSGYRPHYWVSTPGFVTQNYDDAYGIQQVEKVFLLSVKEWESHSFIKSKGEKYWLRTPYVIPGTVRIVGEDGYVYHKKADMNTVGIIPALFIRKQSE